MKYLALLFLLFSCGTKFDPETYLDIHPPVIYNIVSNSPNTLTITSDEEIDINTSLYFSREGLEISDIIKDQNKLTLIFNRKLSVGKEYSCEFSIKDTTGNSINFISRFYGYNPSVPEIVINEFICRGTKTNPDKVELYIKEGGNIGGITLFNGTRNSHDSKFTFPAIPVSKGDYIVIRATSEIYPNSYIEIGNINYAGDSKFISDARDIRTENLSLSSNNGVITLYNNPYGEIIDAVIYSSNINNPEKKYRNFGLKKVADRVDIISEYSEWFGKFEVIFPEDTIYSDNSTTTRSLNRKQFIDSNTRSDWYTVATRESTFGYENSLKEY